MIWEARGLLLFFIIMVRPRLLKPKSAPAEGALTVTPRRCLAQTVAFAQAYTCVFHDETDSDYDSLWKSWLSLFLIAGVRCFDTPILLLLRGNVSTLR